MGASFVRLLYSFVRIQPRFVRLAYAFVRIGTSFVRLAYSFVRIRRLNKKTRRFTPRLTQFSLAIVVRALYIDGYLKAPVNRPLLVRNLRVK